MTKTEIFDSIIAPHINERLKRYFDFNREIQLTLSNDAMVFANGEEIKARINEDTWSKIQAEAEIEGIPIPTNLGVGRPSVLDEIIVLLTHEIYLEVSIMAIRKIIDIFREVLNISDIFWDGNYKSFGLDKNWGINIKGQHLPLPEPFNITISDHDKKKFVTKLILKAKQI